VYLATLPLLRDSGPIAGAVALTEEQAREKIARGEPLLRGCELPFDRAASRRLMLRLAGGLENAGVDGMSRIRRALEEDRLVPAELLLHAADRDAPFIAGRAEGRRLAPSLLWTLAQLALKPALCAWCGQLTTLVRGTVAWDRGICFVCGAPASFAELQGNEEAKHLRCGLCGGDWRFHRLRCVHCGNEDAASLGILYGDGPRDRARVEVCDKCKGYLKVFTRFAPASVLELAIEDLSTLDLDTFAQEQGYRRLPHL
jgi:FdhE protein